MSKEPVVAGTRRQQVSPTILPRASGYIPTRPCTSHFKGHERAFDNNRAVGHVAMPVVDIAVSDKVLFGSVEQNLERGKLCSSGERFVSFCPSVGGKLDEAQNRFQRVDRGCTKEQEPRPREVHRWQMIVPKCKAALVQSKNLSKN